MNSFWDKVKLREVLLYRKEFIRIDDLLTYRRPRIKLHAQGIVLRDELKGALIKTKEQQICKTGDFLVAEIDAKLGGFGIVPKELDGAIVSSHYFLFSIDEAKLERGFLNYFIRTRRFLDQVEAQGSTNYASIRPSHVLDYEIPLPTMSEQRQIVTRIDQIACLISRAQSLRQQTSTETDALISADKTFDLLSTCPRRTLAEVCSVITDGTHQTPRYTDEGAIFLSAQNIKPFRFMPENHRKVSLDDFKTYTAYNKPRRGDVLLTRVGAGIGQAAVVDQDIEFAIYVSLALIRTKEDILLPEYLVHWLNSRIGQEQCRRETLGRGHSQGNLNLKLLRGFELPVPPIEHQRRIVAHLDHMVQKIVVLKKMQDETSAKLNALLPSIIEKACRGEP